MEQEKEKTLKVLQLAIQMEIEGKKFYIQASNKSGNELGRKLLESLAREEDIHRHNFEQIYTAIANKKNWPTTDFKPDSGKRLRTIFTRVTGHIGSETNTHSSEIEDVRTAMTMENKTLDFYTNQAQKSAFDAERAFYEALASEEREHHLILLDYYEYLKNPAGWFIKKEHPSLDGG
jgi:rubrerythrin